jgi:hypothetical protein
MGLTKTRLKNHLFTNFVLSHPLWNFHYPPSPTYLASEILPQRTTAELPEWGLHWILDNCKPVTVSGGDRRIWRSIMVAGLNSAVACVISYASPMCHNRSFADFNNESVQCHWATFKPC